MDITQHEGYTTTEAGSVQLGTTVYTVKVQRMDDGESMTWLTGPKGATYFLRGYLGEDTGKRQVISWKSGQPLRVRGNEVKVWQLGDVIEVR